MFFLAENNCFSFFELICAKEKYIKNIDNLFPVFTPLVFHNNAEPGGCSYRHVLVSTITIL